VGVSVPLEWPSGGGPRKPTGIAAGPAVTAELDRRLPEAEAAEACGVAVLAATGPSRRTSMFD